MRERKRELAKTLKKHSRKIGLFLLCNDKFLAPRLRDEWFAKIATAAV